MQEQLPANRKIIHVDMDAFSASVRSVGLVAIAPPAAAIVIRPEPVVQRGRRRPIFEAQGGSAKTAFPGALA